MAPMSVREQPIGNNRPRLNRKIQFSCARVMAVTSGRVRNRHSGDVQGERADDRQAFLCQHTDNHLVRYAGLGRPADRDVGRVIVAWTGRKSRRYDFTGQSPFGLPGAAARTTSGRFQAMSRSRAGRRHRPRARGRDTRHQRLLDRHQFLYQRLVDRRQDPAPGPG